MAVHIQVRRGTSAGATSSNPILADGELGLETNTGKFKFGDGVTAWNSLGYAGVVPADIAAVVLVETNARIAADLTKADKDITANRQTASYTLVLTDAGKLVEMNVASANNLTVPLNATVAFPIGTQILISQYGAGQTSVVATGGVTIRSDAGKLKITVQYGAATLVKIGTNEWYLFGNISA